MDKGSRKVQLLIFFLLFIVSFSLPNIRAGISQLNMPKTTLANFTVNFNTALPDKVYNQMTTVGYVYDFTPLNGIYINASCPSVNSTQTNLKCMVKALNNNSNNIVYLTYVVSDESDFLCGTYSQDFFFNNATNLITDISINVPPNGKDLGFSDSRFINLLPYIAGVSSTDSDFSLTIGEENDFNSKTQRLNLQIIITEQHSKNVTITFGFLIFDSSKYTISVYEKLNFSPTDIKKDLLYGIGQIKSSSAQKTAKDITPIGPKAPVRLLALVPVVPVSPIRQKSPTSAPPNEVVPSIAEALRNFSLGSKNITVKPTTVNTQAYDQVSQKDGVLASSTMQIFMAIKNIDITRSAAPLVGQIGQDNQVFNRLFSTNGFVILSSASSIDQIYYFEIENISPIDSPSISKFSPISTTGLSTVTQTAEPDILRTASKSLNSLGNPVSPPLLFKSVLYNNDLVQPECSGVVFKVLKQVDYLQKSFLYTCLKCKAGEFLNYRRKRCEKFPLIEAFNNTNDKIV